MTAEHSAYEDLARERRGNEGYHQGYAEARQAFLIGQAVRERRLALGLSQVELAAGLAWLSPPCPAWKQAASYPLSPS